MSGYTYDAGFFDFVDSSSGRSALAFLTAIKSQITPQSVADIGCGRGIWLAAWAKLGVTDMLGVDGAYVNPAALKIERSQFLAHDLTRPLDLNRRFDLVQCLEVAEHIAPESADCVIDNLVKHADMILFSASVPGQGGEFHVNEQPISYWAEKFRARGYRSFDFPRQQVQGMTAIEPWYRYNVLLYVREAAVELLPEAIRVTEIPAHQPIPDFSSLIWRLRCGVIRLLPQAVVHHLARLKHSLSMLFPFNRFAGKHT